MTRLPDWSRRSDATTPPPEASGDGASNTTHRGAHASRTTPPLRTALTQPIRHLTAWSRHCLITVAKVPRILTVWGGVLSWRRRSRRTRGVPLPALLSFVRSPQPVSVVGWGWRRLPVVEKGREVVSGRGRAVGGLLGCGWPVVGRAGVSASPWARGRMFGGGGTVRLVRGRRSGVVSVSGLVVTSTGVERRREVVSGRGRAVGGLLGCGWPVVGRAGVSASPWARGRMFGGGGTVRLVRGRRSGVVSVSGLVLTSTGVERRREVVSGRGRAVGGLLGCGWPVVGRAGVSASPWARGRMFGGGGTVRLVRGRRSGVVSVSGLVLTSTGVERRREVVSGRGRAVGGLLGCGWPVVGRAGVSARDEQGGHSEPVFVGQVPLSFVRPSAHTSSTPVVPARASGFGEPLSSLPRGARLTRPEPQPQVALSAGQQSGGQASSVPVSQTVTPLGTTVASQFPDAARKAFDSPSVSAHLNRGNMDDIVEELLAYHAERLAQALFAPLSWMMRKEQKSSDERSGIFSFLP